MSRPAIEIGGSHVTAALVDEVGCLHQVSRSRLNPSDTAEGLLSTIATTASQIAAAPDAEWFVAIPGPFDYPRGIGRFEGVGKFDSLNNVDVGVELARRVVPAPRRCHFVNDAVAFTAGEWCFGAARGHDRVIGLTLGTGVGSAFLVRGRPVQGGPTVPPGGAMHRVAVDGEPLEELVSTRALVAAYARPGGEMLGLGAIAERARHGEPRASTVFTTAFTTLGRALEPYVRSFDASALVIGGGLAAARDVIETPLRLGLGEVSPILSWITHTEAAALRGALVTAAGGA